ncbi:MAG: IS200/IS605 family accessory protein TnpB-related protein [Candidatus Thermoplasmatota archaeon]
MCDDSNILSLLENYSSYYNFLNRKLLNDIINNGTDKDYINSLKRNYGAKYKIHARLFNSLLFNCKGMLKSQEELVKLNIKDDKSKIKKLIKKIKKASKALLKGYRKSKKDVVLPHERNIYNCNIFFWSLKVNKLKTKNYEKSPMCGSRNFYKKQWNYVSHESWLTEWRRKRSCNLFIVGSGDETAGNQLCQYKDNKLFLTLPLAFKSNELKKIELPVKFYSEKDKKNINYYDYFKEAINNHIAVTYRFVKRENNKWYVLATFKLDRKVNKNITGYIGIDVNYELLATTDIDHNGNFVGFENYGYHSDGTTEQHRDELSLIVKDIVDRAKVSNKAIVIEKLDLSKCKSGHSKKVNRKVSSISYNMFFDLLRSRCLKNNILLKSVNPAFTSIIGKYKYSKTYGIGVHNAAALVIAKRGSFYYKERIPNLLNCILHRAEARKWPHIFRYRHHWKHWDFFNNSFVKCSSKKKLDSYNSIIVDVMNILSTKECAGRWRYLLLQ